jgi:hypothetical protein
MENTATVMDTFSRCMYSNGIHFLNFVNMDMKREQQACSMGWTCSSNVG